MKRLIEGTIIIMCAVLLGVAWVPSVLGASADPEWKNRWDRILAAAKKEGKLMIYGSINPKLRNEIKQGFEDRYGIELEVVAGSSSTLVARWDRERKSGINVVDIMHSGGGSSLLRWKPKGALGNLEPYIILPEVKDPKAWPDGKIRYLDKDKTVIPLNSAWTSYVAVNTNMIKKGELRSYKDLLDPKWKDKIVLYQPTRPGSTAAWAAFMITDAFGPEEGEKFLRQFAAAVPTFISNRRQQAEWIAKGKYPIGVGVNHPMVSQFKLQGAPIDINRFIEGGNLNPGGGCLDVSANPPHPNAATVYINWILSKEGQLAYARGIGAPPVRTDVSIEGLGIDDSKIARPEDKAFLTTENFFLTQAKAIKLAKELWGGDKKKSKKK